MSKKWSVNEDLVISGISGKFPESDNVEEFMDNLYAKRDMVVEDERRWPFGFLGLPKGSGKMKDLSRLDADFFKISEWEANVMDAQIRIVLELTYEAIWDAGIDPNSLSGTKTGVFIGNCFDETSGAQAEEHSNCPGYRQAFAGRLAYVFNLSGPSTLIDTACASSFCALHEAVTALRNNLCERAIVLGANMSLRAWTQLQFFKLNMISPDGHCKCLDADANGYAKGEACVALVLQRKSEAKRIYATIVHTKTNTDGFKENGITFPSTESQRQLMQDTYAEAGVDPHSVKYVEAHCTGTQAGDPVEMAAIVGAMCQGRKEPLLVGAVKSSIGHTEGSSGLCSLTKVIFSMENHCIPANLHMKEPNPKIEGLMSGILKPITENTHFDGKIVGLNCFGFGGVNVHVIVRADAREPSEDNANIFSDIPRLVLMCGRTEEGLTSFLQKVTRTPSMMTRDYLALINDISKTSPFDSLSHGYQGMNYRGFAMIDNQMSDDPIQISVNEVRTEKKPQIWYVFSGMGGQWPTMANSLMCLKPFALSILRSAEVLDEYGFDLITVLTEEDKTIMDCSLNSFVGLAAIQIALVDVLTELDITPDGIVGHSVGELVCAYADNCLTAEEAIRIAYLRGMCVKDELKTRGLMAAIGLSMEELKPRLSTQVFIACHNSEDSITVSGNESAVKLFVDQMNSEDVFARSVDSSGIAFHSPLMSVVTEPLMKQLSTILPKPRTKSSKWVSTTYPESDDRHRNLTAQYMIDNLIEPVLFSDALKMIPSDALVIEVSAHHLLQPIVKRSLGSGLTYVPLMRKNCDNIRFLLESVAKLYSAGVNPSIEKLYPTVSYPVSRGTPTISPLVRWNHQKSFLVHQYPQYFNPTKSSNATVKVDLQDEEDLYLSGHCIDGRVLFPATGYLMLVWKQMAKNLNVEQEELAIQFENVQLHRATILPKVGQVKFEIKMLDNTGHFAIIESGTVAVTGRVFVPQEPWIKFEHILKEKIDNNAMKFDDQNEIVLRTNDIYKELRLRGYDYGPTFQCLTGAVISTENVRARVKWTDNWVTFVDNMIQMAILAKQIRGLYLPVRIECLRCDPKAMAVAAQHIADQEVPDLPVVFDFYTDIAVGAGIEFRGIKAHLAPRKVSQKPVIEEYRFVAFNEICLPVVSADDQLKLYLRRCHELALNVAKKFNICAQSEAKSQLTDHSMASPRNEIPRTSDSQSGLIMEALVALSDCTDTEISDRLMDELREMIFNLDNDLTNRYFNRESFVRQQVETVIENMNTKNNKINILEVSRSDATLAQTVIQTIRMSTNDPELSYHLVHPTADRFGQELGADVHCHQWNYLDKCRLPSDMIDLDLIIYDDKYQLLSSEIDEALPLEPLWTALKDNGFLIIITKTKLNFAEEVLAKVWSKLSDHKAWKLKTVSNDWLTHRKNLIRDSTERIGFTPIATKTDLISQRESLIVRKLSANIVVESQTFVSITCDKCEQWIEKLQNSLNSVESRPESENIWLIAEDSPTNGVIGLVNCLRKEPNGHRIRCIFDYDFDRKHKSSVLHNKKLLSAIVKKDLVMNVLRDHCEHSTGSFRHFTIDLNKSSVVAEHCFLNVQTRGDLSSFKWFEAQHKYWPIGRKDDQELIQVYYAPLNFRDIMLATGKLSADALPGDMALQDCILGLEFAGRDENGNRVMGMVASKGLATTLVMDDTDFVWPVPHHWSMEEASTVPVVYATAYYALFIRGQLKPRESVLIHSGSGGVGQAAIAICLAMECRLFITCGSAAKREFLKKEFSPKLSDNNFWTSRDTTFEAFVMRETNGRGVDVVLNSLSEDKLQASVRCLASSGRFLEIGKYDLSQNNELGLLNLMRNKTFHGILLDSLFVKKSKCSPLVKRHKLLVRKLIDDGIRDGTVRPLKRTVFDSDKVEDAFRFMASGKHIGKVVLRIRDETSDDADVVPRHLSTPRTVFKPNKSYIIVGGLGGFGLELADWMVERGALNLVLTSRSGLRNAYQKYRLKHFKDLGVNIEISTKDVTDLEQTADLLRMASQMGNARGVAGIFNLAMVLSDSLFQNSNAEQFEKVLAPKAVATHNLDVMSRQMCPDLDYFVCFSSVACGRGNSGQSNYAFANSAMERLCERRRVRGLAAQAIQWGAIGDVGWVAEQMGGNRGQEVNVGGTSPQKLQSCLATLDVVLQTEHSVISSCVKADLKTESSHKKGELIKTVSHILGIKDYSTLDANITLGELGMDSLMSVEIKQALERDYDLVMSMQDIRKLTVGHIIGISDKSSVNAATNSPAQSERVSSADLEFEIPTEDVIALNEVTVGKPILLLPPLEGSFRLLKALAQRMRRPVIGLNWTHDCRHLKSIEESAHYYLSLISSKIEPTLGPAYDLMGYSFGGVIAYEIALQLQMARKTVPKVVLLDSSPVQFHIYALEVNKRYALADESVVQLESLVAFLQQYVAIDTNQVRQTLVGTRPEQRAERVAHIMLDSLRLESTERNVEFVCDAFANKLLSLNAYDVLNRPKLDSDLLLVRAKDLNIISDHTLIRHDYGLQDIITGKCETLVMSGNHKSFIDENLDHICLRINNYFK